MVKRYSSLADSGQGVFKVKGKVDNFFLNAT
jgi:hypothetical protein